MALIAALLPDQLDRDSLSRAAPPHQVLWASSWRNLHRMVRKRPVAAAVADLHAETRKDGVLRVYRFARRFPLTPVIVWGEMDGRELYRLGKAGAWDVVASRDADDAQLVGEVLEALLQDNLARLLLERLEPRLPEESREIVRHAASHIPDRIQVPGLAAFYGMSVSTLERRFERWGLPTPGRLLLWFRVLYGLRWLLEPGRSVESVADQLGYSSGAAFRRAIKATIGGRPSPLRNARGFDQAVSRFLAECAGQTAAAPPGGH
ncbi:MAG: helix-turn-helix transcriptional regulator [Gemmatimonadetes bacterium]|nr:helix-turn-helix transcriptional regulator [Gemmatimonadota bacterium]